MTALRARFQTLDDLEAPKLWPEIQSRAASVQPQPGISGLWAIVAVTVVLAAALGGAVLVGSGVVELPGLPVQPVLPGGSPSPDAHAESAWTATGSMATPLNGPTVLLADGRVLIAGGLAESGIGPRSDESGIGLPSAELYDPRTESWTATGIMIGRAGHTATLLPDGTVLVAGGQSSSGMAVPRLESAELYDPGTGSWTATGAMIEGRAGHTATLLPDGTVLVAGGLMSGGSDMLASAEVYDPRTGSWTATGGMIEDRSAHTATLLDDGSVLVTGGGNGLLEVGSLSSAERYDPRTGSWTATGDMIQGRAGHTATLLHDGNVLVAGSGNFGVLGSAELYDPRTGSWTATGTMIEGRGGHSATLLPDGRVLVAGGANHGGDWAVTGTTELYDESGGSWTATGSLGLPRKGHSAVLLFDGRVLVAGGNAGIGDRGWDWLATAELYGPVSGD
jgi:hypothetical protein